MIPGSANPLLLAAEAGAYEIERSLRFNSSDSAYLSRTPSVAGNRKTWTWAGWVKRSKLGADQQIWWALTPGSPNLTDYIRLESDDTFRFFTYNNSAGSFVWQLHTSAKFRDPSSWYHIVCSIDTTQSTASDRAKLYINGHEVTDFSTSTYPSQNYDTNTNNTVSHNVAAYNANSSFFDGYLADVHLIDGQALDPTSFGEFDTNGVWQPKAYTGTYGTNGFHLPFSDNSTAAALGTDTSGNGNDWTPYNVSVELGGPTSVAAASGALPILNTTDTYGQTLGSGVRADSNSSNLVLASALGTSSGLNLTDQSPAGRPANTLTLTGSTGVSSTTGSYHFYGGAARLSGTSPCNITSSTSSTLAFGSSDYTIEFWFKVNGAGSNSNFYTILDARPADTTDMPVFGINSSNAIKSYGFPAGTPDLTHTATVYRSGGWNHLAATKSGQTHRIFLNGIQIYQSTSASNPSATTTKVTLGESNSSVKTGRFTFNGDIQDVRIYKGVAKYTSNFNPPASTRIESVAAANDSLVDTPTSYGADTGAGGEVRGNYATLNPLVNFNSSTLTNGNLDISCASVSGQWRTQKGGWGFYGGKFYFEATLNAGGSAGNSAVGIGLITLPHSANTYPGKSAGSYAYLSSGGKIDSGSSTYPWATWTINDVIGVATDLTAGTVAFYKNGTLQGSMTGLDTTLTYEALVGSASNTASQYSLNFGQRPFAYTAPSGFKALCDTNLPAPVVAQPSTVMDVKLYTGNGSTQTISGLEFSPDLVWIKNRAAADNHKLLDTIRGATNELESNTTDAEVANADGLTAFNSDGFDLGADVEYNTNAETYVAWTWDAGSSTVTNTDGSITSSVRANASAGFSIVTYTGNGLTGQSIGHGLGVPLKMCIIKMRSGSQTYPSWYVRHESMASNHNGRLELTAATNNTITDFFQGGIANLTSSAVVSFNTGSQSSVGNVNTNGNTYIAYCFAPVDGYSSFGSYTGNGSTDGPFVYTGLRPRFLMLKRTDSADNWAIIDTARSSYNVSNNTLWPNASTAEATTYPGGAAVVPNIDFTANGFKLRAGGNGSNVNSATYIYAAFAEHPFKTSRAR